MATYELWDERTEQTIGRWPTESMALHVVRDLLDRGEIVAVAALVLRVSDWSTPSSTIATGSQLVAMARVGTGEEWTRNRRRRDMPHAETRGSNDDTASTGV